MIQNFLVATLCKTKMKYYANRFRVCTLNKTIRVRRTIGGYTDKPTDSSLIDTDHIENDASNSYSTVACIRCHGNVFTEPLPSNDRGYKYRHTDWWEGFMKYANEMGSAAMIYLRSFINTDSGIQKLIRVGYTDRHTGRRSYKPTLEK
jgi:hypothetical protein